MGSVVVRKNGGFYSIYGNDCYVLYYLFNYRIIDDIKHKNNWKK